MKEHKTSKNEQLKWQAEDIVKQSFVNTPEFGRAVRKTIVELKKVQVSVRKTFKNKK